MKTSLPAFAITAVIFSIIGSLKAEPVQDIQVLQGSCGTQSNTAEGGANDDLTKRKSRFFCDSAVLTFFDKTNRRILIQFSDKHSNHERVIGFGGLMRTDGVILDVTHLYLEPSKPLDTNDGACKLFFAKRHMTDIVCVAQVPEGQRRTVASVVFKASPGQ